MRRRQQQILEKMRSQQMQFLSANGDAMEDEASGGNRNDTESHTVEVDTDSDSYDEAMDSEEDVEEDHEEEDEWGFPTGQVDVRLYSRPCFIRHRADAREATKISGSKAAAKTQHSKFINHGRARRAGALFLYKLRLWLN